MTVSVSRIAILGASCRLPSVNGLADFWQILSEQRCVISQVQTDRFETDAFLHAERTRPGRSVTFAAGQLDRPYDFDPTFFGISRREAAVMDPQQRIMLEVVQEAFEHAGLPTDTLAGCHVGVYVGASSLDYSSDAQLDPAVLEPQSMTGNTLSIIANRISYIFDLRGPSYVLDTACSSSLLALHNAIEDIRAGRIDTAIVGGVSMLFNPLPFIGFSRASMLSAHGLCRAFDAGADGYVRSEGAVAIILRAADVAESNGDTIRAELVASGTNADGRTAGLSLPSPTAQAQLLHDIYEQGAVDRAKLAFVEAHGTGTPVGDPIEADAIGKVLARDREAPLPIGSVKTNFGHLEPASGLVGLLKAQMALEHNVLPASLHFETPNPNIPFADLNLAVASEPVVLTPQDGQQRLAGVNSFGFGGTNTHVVVADPRPQPAPRAVHSAPLILSGASEDALKALAEITADRIEHGTSAAEMANAAAFRRSRLTHRAVVAPGSDDMVAAALRAVVRGMSHPLLSSGEALLSGAREPVVFAYSGNGSQWAGMGRETYQSNATFRDAFDKTDRLFISRAGWSLVSMLFSSDLESEIERTEIAQPLLFALQVALTEALGAAGLRPAVIVGHSVGEVAGAWASGALTLADAVMVIHARSTHQEMTRHLGGMAAVLTSAEDAREAIAPFRGLEIAAVNSPRSITVSGPADALAEFAAAARKKRLAVKRLPLDYPFHCALVDPIRDDLLASLAGVRPSPVSTPMVSTVTLESLEGPELGATYWWDNVREPVRFADAIAKANEMARVVIEIGPRPVLTNYVRDTARDASRPVSIIGSLSQPEQQGDPLPSIVGHAIAVGAAVDDEAVFGAPTVRPDILPAYPWQHETFRLTQTVESKGPHQHPFHPLLGYAPVKGDGVWHIVQDAMSLPLLADHKVESTVVFPAAGFVEMLLAVGRQRHPAAAIELRDLDIYAALVLSESTERDVRTREVAPATFVIESRPRLSDDAWTPHVKGTVTAAPMVPDSAPQDLPEDRTVDHDSLYAITERYGLFYGPAFRRADHVSLTDDGQGVSHLLPPSHAVADGVFALDPTLFDSAFHGLFAFLAEREGDTPQAVLPTRVGRLILAENAGQPVRAELTARRPVEGSVEADFVLFDAAGLLVASVTQVRFVAVPLSTGHVAPIVKAAPLLKRLPRIASDSALQIELPADLIASGELEPDDGQLLTEAGITAAAQIALEPLFAEPTAVAALVRSGALASSAVPLAVRLLTALEASERAVQDEDGRWALIGDAIPINDVISVLMTEHQTRLAETAVIAALPDMFADAFREGLGEANPLSEPLKGPLLSDAPFAATLYAALEQAFQHAIADHVWTSDSLQIVLVGASNAAFLRRMIQLVDPATMRLTITDRDEAVLDRASLIVGHAPGIAFTKFDELDGVNHPFDLVLSAPVFAVASAADISSLIRSGGTCLIATFSPSLLADAVGGLAAPWWQGSTDPSFPVGALASADEWSDTLQAAGLSVVRADALNSMETDGLVLQATRPEGAGEPKELGEFGLHAFGGLARKTMDALAALISPGQTVGTLADPIATDQSVVAVSVASPDELSETFAALGQLMSAAGPDERTVWLVTFGAHGDGSAASHPPAAAVQAFARVAANEFPHLCIRLVDLTRDFEPSVGAVRLAAELGQPNDEREIALFSDHRAAVRYLALPAEQPLGDAVTLALPQRGSIDYLAWQPCERTEPGPDDVTISVETTGLNFRDVMWALGLLPSEALQDGFAGATLGMEAAGTVSAVGSNVTDFAVGDAVLAFAPAAFASHVTLRAAAVVKRPEILHAEAAATVPVTFLTAYYALVELAHLEAGETVLIHGGAGGVGLAAMQIAKECGATVFATGGSPAKRALLTALGADAVFDSRSLRFADDVMAETGGEGIDVVLNSLAGEAMERSLSVLKPFGRFLELGKRDFYADTKLGLRPFRQNLSYFGIDADQLMKYRPKLAERVLKTLMEKFADGTYTALPYRAFDAQSVGDAFRLMQSANHIGKIVVCAPELQPREPKDPTPFMDPERRYVMVGGTSGFGFATAEWMIDQGAQHLVLISRSGVRDETIAARIEAHRAAGASIDVVTCDATDADALSQIMADLNETRPIAGVFHMAMVLDDGLITSLDAERHARVLGPKVHGVDALEAATASMDLDLFVVYSSLTVQLGNPGQANYVAANAYQEAAMASRRARGLPGLAVAWGAIADVGVVARDKQTSDLLQRKLGAHAITAQEGLDALGQMLEQGAMTSGPAVRMIGRVDWAAARKDLVLAASPAFEDLAEPARAGADDADAADLKALLAGLSATEAQAKVTELLGQEISRILKMPASEIEAKKPLTAIGMDSLMGVELRMAAEQRLGIDIPLMSLASGATLSDLAGKVVTQLGGGAASEDQEFFDQAVHHMGEDVKSDEEVMAVIDKLKVKTTDTRTILE